MDNNPWQVRDIREFSYFHCPECEFYSQEENTFQDHAVENHPLSFVFFNENFENNEVTDMIKVEMEDYEEMDTENGDLDVSVMNTSIGEHFMGKVKV